MPITLEPDGRVPIPVRRHPLVARLAAGLQASLADAGASSQGESPGTGEARPRLVLAVSGGADSTALLLAAAVLTGHRQPWPSPLVVHVNHGLRPSAADEDAAFVAELADRLRLEHHSCTLPADLATRRGNLAANARNARYAALTEVAAARGIAHVVTAHHAGDQLETALLGLARGASVTRLAMSRWRPLTPGVGLLRPWLTEDPQSLRSLCRAAGVRWREDPGNRDPRRPRARLRTNVLPVLESMHPGAIVRAAASLTDPAAAAETDIAIDNAHLTDGPPAGGPARRPRPVRIDLRRDDLRRASGPEAAAAIRRAALAVSPDLADRLTRRHIGEAVARARDADVRPRELAWPSGATCRVSAHTLTIDGASVIPISVPPG